MRNIGIAYTMELQIGAHAFAEDINIRAVINNDTFGPWLDALQIEGWIKTSRGGRFTVEKSWNVIEPDSLLFRFFEQQLRADAAFNDLVENYGSYAAPSINSHDYQKHEVAA
jgi:hypothetical protein